MNINTGDNTPAILENLGWDHFFQQHYEALQNAGTIPARIASGSRGSFQVFCQLGELTAGISGKMRYQLKQESGYPVAGDWVIVEPVANEQKCVIQALLPRKSKFSRKAAGELTEEQVISANIDTVFLVSGLDGGRNFNLRRIERYLTLAWSSGALPVIILNKSDLCTDVDAYIEQVEGIAPGVSIHAVSAIKKTGLQYLSSYLARGKTAAFLGSSGAGKSALINALLGEERQKTGEIRASDLEGKHTTTRRELIQLPGGGIVIDTPGMREIQVWGGEDDLLGAFQDIENLAEQCRFADCQHEAEPGCAVRTAMECGTLDPARLASYRKLQKELKYLAARENQSTRQYEKARWKKIAKWAKEINNNR